MTEQTQRALERLPKYPYSVSETDECFYTRDREGAIIAPQDSRSALAYSELAARSPQLLELLDRQCEQARRFLMLGGYLPPYMTEANVAAEALLRETTRVMLGESL